MHCPACGTDQSADALFCQRCGARVAADQPEQKGEPHPQRPARRRTQRRSLRRFSGRARHPHAADTSSDADGALGFRGVDYLDNETVLWSGTFSWKGMIHEFLLASMATIALSAGGLFLFHDDSVWPTIAAFVVSGWGLLFCVLIFRKLNFHYTLTSQRLIHERGILYRILDRAEMIDVDDVRVEQDILERIANVGKIRLRTSDRTDPFVTFYGISNPREIADMMDDARRRERMRRGIHLETV